MIFSKRTLLQGIALLTAGLGLSRTNPARAEAQSDAALAVIKAWYLPRVDALGTAFVAQQKAWEACAPGTDAAPLRAAFQNAFDAWIATENATFGPLGVQERADRANFFPDRRNAIVRSITDLLERATKGPITAADIAGTSVAGQGLPALERLLYDANLQTAFVADPVRGRARCAVGLAIAQNLVSIAEETKAQWQAPGGIMDKLAAGQGMPPAFADGRQALALEVGDLATGLQKLVDIKMRRFLGADTSKANPLLAEGSRSGRVKRNMVVAADSMRDLAVALAVTTPDVTRMRVGKIADRMAENFSAMPEDIAERAKNPDRRGDVIGLISSVRSLQDAIGADLAPALDVQLGFNALDGD